MAKYIIDEEKAMETIRNWRGNVSQTLLWEIIEQGEKLITCEECSSAEPAVAPFLQKDFVHCSYYRTDMHRNHYCKHGGIF
jgi:hypothetical protein